MGKSMDNQVAGKYTEKISISEKIAYGGGDLASNLILVLTSTFLTYNLVTTFLYTMINIPYGALTSLMTRDQNQRTVINIYRMFMAQIGSLAINAFTLPFINGIGGSSSQKSWIIVSVIYGFIAAAALAIIGAAGYDGLAAVQTAEAVSAIKMVYLALPVPFLIAIPVFYKFYKLDEIYPTVMKELEEGENIQQQ